MPGRMPKRFDNMNRFGHWVGGKHLRPVGRHSTTYSEGVILSVARGLPTKRPRPFQPTPTTHSPNRLFGRSMVDKHWTYVHVWRTRQIGIAPSNLQRSAHKVKCLECHPWAEARVRRRVNLGGHPPRCPQVDREIDSPSLRSGANITPAPACAIVHRWGFSLLGDIF